MTTDLRDLFPGTTGLDEKSVQALLAAIKKNYNPGEFDYLKFKQSVLSLIQMGMDEATAFKSAFTTASTLGVTKDSLSRSAQSYNYTLQNERENFAEALLSQKKHKIEGRRSEVDELQQKIEQHKYRIKELEREISIFQNRIDTVDQDVEAAKAKIEGTKNRFLNVYEVIDNDIKNDIQLISKYL